MPIISPKMESVSDPYLESLDREVALWAEHVDTRRPVMQFHWGGGTPTYLNVEQIRRTHAMVADRFRLTADAEQSIEIHVSWTRDEQIHALQSVIFVAQEVPAPSELTHSWLIRHDWILSRVLLDPSYAPALGYVSTTLISDDVALREMREGLFRQRKLVEDLKQALGKEGS